ncbi:MAG: hypothetical protein WAV30_01210 [Microgenomates group bacterium]
MNKKSTYSIYIYNPIEDEWPLISSFPKEKQKKYITSSNRFADCYLFANSFLPSFTLITPIPLDQEFISYFHTLTGSQCTPITPKGNSPFICENIMKDSLLFTKLLEEAKRYGSITLYSYAISKQVFLLIEKLKDAGAVVYLPEGPSEKDLWTVAHFGSKCGFRKSFPHLMPEGSIHHSYKDAISAASAQFISGNGVVMKTNRGNAGEGVFIFKKSKTISDKTIVSRLKKLFVDHPYLKKHSLVVEKFIDTSHEKRCPFPSIECFIHQNGRIEIPYYCNMIVSPEGEFYGMEMHKSVFTAKIKKDVFRITKEIANTYRKNGYRGRFDVDMICDGTHVYADESNTRINGGTDTYMIVKKVIGSAFFSSRYVFAHYIALSPTRTHSLQSMMTLCKPLLYDPKTKTGLIINSGSAISSGGLSYIIVEKTKRSAFKMHERLKVLLGKE